MDAHRPLYLDHAASAPLLPAAREAMLAAAAGAGNPSSIHTGGQRARAVVEDARATVAATLGADPIEVVFTASGTESVNLAIQGLFQARVRTGATRILVPKGEHHATLDTVEWLARTARAEVIWLPLDSVGRVRLAALEAALSRDPVGVALVTALWANNEVGTIADVAGLARLTAAAGVPLHLDAVAAYGWCPIDLRAVRVASNAAVGEGLVAVSVAGHKIGGPAGAGALAVHRSARMEPLIHGGGQQRGLRSGTEATPAIAGLAAAASMWAGDAGAAEAAGGWGLSAEWVRVAALRDALVRGVVAQVPGVRVSGDTADRGPAASGTVVPSDAGAGRAAGCGDAVVPGRLPGNAHFVFAGCRGDAVLFLLDQAGIAVSTGSACQAGVAGPSHVLLAMGYDDREAASAIRVTLGHTTSPDDVERFLAVLPEVVAQARRA